MYCMNDTQHVWCVMYCMNDMQHVWCVMVGAGHLCDGAPLALSP